MKEVKNKSSWIDETKPIIVQAHYYPVSRWNQILFRIGDFINKYLLKKGEKK